MIKPSPQRVFMRKAFKVVQIIWTVTALTTCTAIGIAYGWQTGGIGEA